jgi:hypothetical protein
MNLFEKFIDTPFTYDLVKSVRRTSIWRNYRKINLESEYIKRVQFYHKKLDEQGKQYSTHKTLEKISGLYPKRHKKIGRIHTFAVIPGYDWHDALFPQLHHLGKVTRFDWMPYGLNIRAEIFKNPRQWLMLRNKVNQELLETIAETHRKSPIDWIFFYTEGRHLLKNTLKEIRNNLGIPTVMMCLDDKQSWQGIKLGGQFTGQVDLVSEVDFYWTSARECCNWVFAEGGNPVYMPEGCDGNVYRPMNERKKYDLVFIGAAYGFRKKFITRIRKAGIKVKTFGPGWEKDRAGVWGEEMVKALNSGWINLGHGGIGYSEDLMNVKTRDFEAPVVGTAAYLTSFHPDLAQHFDVGREIYCFNGDTDLVEQANCLLSNKERIIESAQLARKRCLREHQWHHRYQYILEILNIID